MIVGEVVAGEGAVLACRFVEHRDMRLDAVLIDQPAEHLGRAISTVAHELGRIEIEALHRAFDHVFGGEHLGLPDRRGCLDIDDDRVVKVDQIVGRVAKEGLPTMGACPARCRISRRDELGALLRSPRRRPRYRAQPDIL